MVYGKQSPSILSFQFIKYESSNSIVGLRIGATSVLYNFPFHSLLNCIGSASAVDTSAHIIAEAIALLSLILMLQGTVFAFKIRDQILAQSSTISLVDKFEFEWRLNRRFSKLLLLTANCRNR
jgi:hypothetical protein